MKKFLIKSITLILASLFMAGTCLATTIDVWQGGTGQNWLSAATGTIPYFSDTGIMGLVSTGTEGQVLKFSSGVPSWGSDATGADVYWTGTSTNLVAADGRSALGLGTMALLPNSGSTTITTLGTISAGIWEGTAITNAQIASSTEFLVDNDTTYSATGTLLDLTSTTFSINEGTLTNNKGCIYSTGTGLVCNSDFLTSVAYSDLTGYPADVITAGTGLSWSASTTLNWSSTGLTWEGNALTNDLIASSTEFLAGGDDFYWTGTSTNLVAADGRSALGLGTMAIEANTGSTTITTLGTIGTGTWEGTAIDISDYTNLATSSPITLTGDTIGLGIVPNTLGGLGQDVSGWSGILTVSSGTFATTSDNTSNWDTAYGWGDHSSAGYYTTSTDSYLLNTGDASTGDYEFAGDIGIGATSHETITVNGTSKDIQLGIHGDSVANEYGIYADRASATHTSKLILARARGSHASPSAVADGDILGNIEFLGWDGTDMAIGAHIRAVVDGTPGSNDMPTELLFRTTPDGTTTPTTRLVIKEDGSIGIGTTTPSRLLEVVNDGGDANIAVTGGTGNAARIMFGDADDDDIGYIAYANNTNRMIFRTNTSEQMTIREDGKVGIGTTTPSEELQVQGTGFFTSGLKLPTAWTGILRADSGVVSTTSASAGDMLKSTYDSGEDGIIDNDAGGTGIDTSGWTGLITISSGTWATTTNNTSNWDTAYGWGDWNGNVEIATDTDIVAGTGLSFAGATLNWSSSELTWAGNAITNDYIASSTEFLASSNDYYWTGTSTNLVAADGRTSLGLGTMAIEANTGSTTITTLGTIGTGTWEGTKIDNAYVASSTEYLADNNTTYTAGTGLSLDGTEFNWSSSGLDWAGNAITNAYIASSTEFLAGGDDFYWTGTSTNLVAATGRASLGLGTMAIEANTGSTTITTLGTISTGTWEATDVGVEHGGTGVSSFTDHGVLLGSGTGAITVTAVGEDGMVLIGEDGSDPSWANITETGDALVITNGAASIDFSVHATLESVADSAYTGDDAITLVGTIATGTWEGTAIDNVRGGTGADTSGWTGTIRIDAGTFSTTTALDAVGTGLDISGTTINTDFHEYTTITTLAGADEIILWQDTAGEEKNITWTNFMDNITYVDNDLTGILTVSSGQLATTTDNSTNWDTAYTDRLKWDGGDTDLVAATGRTSLGLGTMAIEANTGSTTITTLGTIGTGTWNATAIDISDYTNLATSTGIALTDDTLSLNLLTSGSDGDSSSTSTDSGLEFVSSQLSLIRGCGDGEILVWDEDNDYWECSSAGAGDMTKAVYDNDEDNLIDNDKGGTAVDSSGWTGPVFVTAGTWATSTIDISDYTNLVAGTNISLSEDTLNVDDAFLVNDASDETTGTLTADSFELGDEDYIGIDGSNERIIFDTAGDISFMGADVGIGATTSLKADLDVVSNASTTIFIRTTDTSADIPGLKFGQSNDYYGYLRYDSTNDYVLLSEVAGGNETTFIVLDGGNVGIGTTTPAQELDVEGDINLSGQIYLDDSLWEFEKGFYLENPDVESLNDAFWFMNNVTLTYVWCKTGTGTVTLNLEDGSDNNILSSELVCDADGQTSCSSGCDVNTINGSYDNITALTEDIDVDISATSSPDKVSLQIGYTID